jgi:hypothetical protein
MPKSVVIPEELTEDMCSHEIEAFEIFVESGYQGVEIDQEVLDTFRDVYAGVYQSRREFAMEMAEESGYDFTKEQWPATCIDWDYAARELMYDYWDENGACGLHFFRNV